MKDEDLKDMTNKQLSRGVKLRNRLAKVLPWSPLALAIAATYALFSLIPGIGTLASLVVSLAVGWGVQKVTTPPVIKATARIRDEQHSMQMFVIARARARELEEQKAAAALKSAPPPQETAPAAKTTVTEDFARAKETGMPLEQAIAVKGPLKFKKPGASP